MDRATLSRLRAARDDLRAQTAGLEVILADLDGQPVAKLRSQQGRVAAASAHVLEIIAVALCDDTAVKG